MNSIVSDFCFGHIKCDDNYGGRFKVKIGESILSVAASPGKWFTNINMARGESFELVEGDSSKVLLEVTDDKVFHPDQLKFDAKYNIKSHSLEGEQVFYSLMGDDKNPKNILVTFSGVSNFDNVNYRLSALTSVQARLKNTLIIAFQDREGVYGNYMYKTSTGYPVKAIVISFINGIAARFGIDASRIIFYGNSKGGSVALDYVDKFPDSYFFVDIPQMDLFHYKSQNDLMRYSIGVEARRYYNFLDYLPRMVNSKFYYSFAENDYDASRGLKMSSFSGVNVNMLKDMGHSNSAMELVKRQFSKIVQIVNDSGPSERPVIDSILVIRDDKLYFRRALGAFKTEQERSRIYSEINFVSDVTNYSVSLNKIVSDKGLVVWWRKGFEFKKHLADGFYRLSLSVYHDYKQFVYPLNNCLIVGDSSSVVPAGLE